MIHVQHFKTNLINREGLLTAVYSGRAVGRSVVGLPSPCSWSLHRRHRLTDVHKDVRSSGTGKAFTIFTWTIMHLVYAPKLCITIVFDFSWDDCNTLENLETLVMQNSEGENKVHYGLYESSDYKRCKVCVKLSYLTDNLVPRSPRSCAGLRKWRLRDGPTRRAQESPLRLSDERISEAQGKLTNITSFWHADWW